MTVNPECPEPNWGPIFLAASAILICIALLGGCCTCHQVNVAPPPQDGESGICYTTYPQVCEGQEMQDAVRQ